MLDALKELVPWSLVSAGVKASTEGYKFFVCAGAGTGT